MQLIVLVLTHQINDVEPHLAKTVWLQTVNDWLFLFVIFSHVPLYVFPKNSHGYFPHCLCVCLVSIFHLLGRHIVVDCQEDVFSLSCTNLMNRNNTEMYFMAQTDIGR